MLRFAAAAVLAVLTLSVGTARGQELLWNPGDQYWSKGFSLPQPAGEVLCATQLGGTLVIGGIFQQIGTVRARNLAVWNGTDWAEFGGGTDGPVYTLLASGSDLFVGGGFRHIGDQTALGVARWDGAHWHAFGNGLSAYYSYYDVGVRALALYRGELIAGGDFDATGSFPLNGLARWNGAGWVPISYDLNGPVLALAVLADTLVIGGSFTRVDGQTIDAVSKWNGSQWSAMGAGFPPPTIYGQATVRALAAFQGKIYAGGYLDDTGASQVAVWNGTAWERVGNSGWVQTFAVARDTLFVGGAGVWSLPQDSTDSTPQFAGAVLAVAPYGPDLFVASGEEIYYPGSDSVMAMNLAIRRSGVWEPMISWDSDMHGLSAGTFTRVEGLSEYRSELVATGYFTHAGDPPHWSSVTSPAAWNGTSWRSLPRPTVCGGYGPTVLFSDGDTLYLGGRFQCPSDVPVLRFDGSAWTPLDPLPLQVHAMAVYQGDLYVAGDRWDSSLYPSEVYRWRNGHWNRIGGASGFGGTTLTSLVVFQDRLIAAGRFDGFEGEVANSVAAWDGTSWTTMGAFAPYYYGTPFIRALTVHRGTLVAAGRVIYQGSVFTWDGTRWNQLGELEADPLTIISTGGELFVGGYVRAEPYSSGDDGIAHWTGRRWERMGSGLNAPALALQGFRGSLYVGGMFTRAGSGGSFGIARWDRLRETLGAPRASLAPGAPNPFRSSSRIAYHLQEASGVHIVVCNIQGRRIRVLEHAWRNPGDHSVIWDGRDDDGRSVASGVYYVQLLIGEQVKTSQKIVLLR